MVILQVEAELGYPGGKAKIIHKESDMIMAFAINKVKVLLPNGNKVKVLLLPAFVSHSPWVQWAVR